MRFRPFVALLVALACGQKAQETATATSDVGGPDAATGEADADASAITVTSPSAGEAGTGDGTSSTDAGDGNDDGPDPPIWEQLIGASPYPRLVIEVDYVPGRAPRQSSSDQLAAVLEAVLDKPGGVEIVLDQELDSVGSDHAWTLAERTALATATFDLPVPDDTIKIHALFVDGHAAEDDRMQTVLLGVAWGHESIMMWRDTLDAGCEALVVGALVEQLCAEAEFLIWQHEVGHVVGLVDADLPMVVDHLDPTPGAGKHDVSHDCVMYRAYEGLDALDAVLDRLLGGAPPIELDANCLADIDAAK